MAKFCEYRDLFKWNKQLMEDDWNDGQAYTVKHTLKGEDTEFVTTAKVGEAKSDAHKVSLEHKMTMKTKGADITGPFDSEVKLKNNGEMACDMKFDFLKSYEGLENVRLLAKGTYNSNATPGSFGFSFLNDTVKYDQLMETTGNNGMKINCTYQAAPWLILGCTKSWKSFMDPMNNVAWSAGATGHFEKNLQWGVLLDGHSETISDTAVKASTLYFNHNSNNRTVGAEMKYDVTKKAFACKLGLKLDEADHSWKFRLHDSGLARAAL